MITTKSELKRALEANCNYIVVGGELAKQIIKKKRNARRFKVAAGLTTAIASIVAIPFSGGASSAGAAMGVASAIGASALTISTKELAILCGAVIVGYAIKEKYNIEIDQRNGRVIFKKN